MIRYFESIDILFTIIGNKSLVLGKRIGHKILINKAEKNNGFI